MLVDPSQKHPTYMGEDRTECPRLVRRVVDSRKHLTCIEEDHLITKPLLLDDGNTPRAWEDAGVGGTRACSPETPRTRGEDASNL